jgi:hypothetical protein
MDETTDESYCDPESNSENIDENGNEDDEPSFADRDEHSRQMVRVLHRRLQALVEFAIESGFALPQNDRGVNDSNIGQICQRVSTSTKSDIDDNREHDDDSPINTLAYRNPHTPHTTAEKRMESLFVEYQDEVEASNGQHVLERSRSSRKFSAFDLLDRERRRKKLKSMQAIAENNSTKNLSRAPNSVIYRVNGEFPIGEHELNPSLYLEMSLHMIQHPNTRRDMKDLTIHETSKELLVNAFWLCHVQFFQKISFKEQTYLLSKISTIYPKIIRVITQAQTQHKRDILFRTYPLVLAKAIYLAFVYLFPGGAGQFQGSFQRVLSHSIFRLMTGVDICKDSVDSLRQKLYHDQFEVLPNKEQVTDHGAHDSDLPRQQQRVTFDAYKITPLLQRYIGGDIPTSNRIMLKRTLPSDHCQVGGVCTFRQTRVTLLEDAPDHESRVSALKDRIKKKALALKNIETLQNEQQRLLKSTRKARSEFVGDLLTRRSSVSNVR